MKQNFFAVDLGATSGRTILGTFIEGGLNLEEINRFPNHLIEVGGHFYWDIYALYRHIIDGLKLVAHRGESIASIGIDTWGVDFVCVGKDGNLLRQPYAYRDPHTVGAPEALFSHGSYFIRYLYIYTIIFSIGSTKIPSAPSPFSFPMISQKRFSSSTV